MMVDIRNKRQRCREMGQGNFRGALKVLERGGGVKGIGERGAEFLWLRSSGQKSL